MAGISKAERERRAAEKRAADAEALRVASAPPFTRDQRLAAIVACLPYVGIPATFDDRLERACKLADLLLARVL